MFVYYNTSLQVNNYFVSHIETKSKHSIKIMSIPSMRTKPRQFYSICKMSLNINKLRQIKIAIIDIL